jgi:hypothetical protein
VVRSREELCPIRRYASLCGIHRNPSGFHLVGEVILDPVLYLEITIFKGRRIRTTFWPDVSQAISTPEFQWHQMIQFADLVIS